MHRPFYLLCAIVVVAGVFSAFFVNDTMCLVLTPLVLDIGIRLNRNPVPYLLAVAMAANIGSVATITGNPQNMMIGTFSQIPYRTFAAHLAPVAAVGLGLTILLISLVYRTEFAGHARVDIDERRVRVNRGLLMEIDPRGRVHARPVFCRLVRPQGRHRRRGLAAGHPPRQTREDLPRDRLVPAGPVRRSLHRDCRDREDRAAWTIWPPWLPIFNWIASAS